MKQFGETTLYNALDLAEILGLQIRTINQMCREKTIKATKVGRSWQVTEDNLNEYLKGGKKR